MKKILLSLMAMFAIAANAAIDLTDPSTFTVKVLDFKNDTELVGQSITLGSTGVGTAWDTGNAKYQTIFPATSPSVLVGNIAFQAVANGGSGKGYWLREGHGLVMINATRSGAVTNLVAGQIVVFQLSGNFSVDATGGGENEATYEREISEDGKTLTYSMMTDGNLGFCISAKSTTNAIQSISIYKEKVAGVVDAPTAKITGAAGVGRVITITSVDESASIYWSTEKEGTYSLYEGPVSTEAAMIYAYAQVGETKSEIIEIETGAGELVKLNGVTVTRTGDTSFKFTTSQADVIGNPIVGIVYTIAGSEETTVASGTVVADVNGDIKAWAALEGYTSSDVTEVAFVAPYEKGEKGAETDFVTLGAENAGYTPAEAETTTFTDVEGTYYSAGVGNIYLEVAQSGSNYAWLYRSGKGNSNFKCQYADAYMVFADVEVGTVVDIYAGNDNLSKAPIKNVVNGELGYSYDGHYFVKATVAGNLAVQFSTGSMIMNTTQYAAPKAPAMAELVSVTPEAGSKVDAETVYTVTFSQPVKYTSYLSDICIGVNPFSDGDGAIFTMSEDQKTITAKLDMETISAWYGCSTAEELAATFGSTVTLHLWKVKDLATGEELEYNDPDDEPQFTFTYRLSDPVLFAEPADGTTVTSLDNVYFGCKDGIALADGTKEVLVIKDKSNILKVPASDLTEMADMGETQAYVLTFTPALTENGTYEIYVPEGTFTLAGEVENATSIFTYTIAGEITPAAITVTPAEGAVTELKNFNFTYGDGDLICPSSQDGTDITIADANGNVVATITQDDLNMNIDEECLDASGWNVIMVKGILAEAITAPGTYTMTVPACAFYLGENYDNSPETKFTWTIDAATGISAVAAGNNKAIRFNLAGQRTNAIKGIVIENGKKVVK